MQRFTVKDIDSIQIHNQWHKKITVTSLSVDIVDEEWAENYVWIEGIGGLNGLLNSFQAAHPTGGDGISLSCYYKNNELIYKPNQAEECFVWKTDFSEFWDNYHGGIIELDSFIAALMD